MPRLGMRARFPEPPDEFAAPHDFNGVAGVIQGFELDRDDVEMTCALTEMQLADRRADAEVVDQYLEKGISVVERKERKDLGQWLGAQVEGTSKNGKHQLSRFTLVGNAFLLASVEAKPKNFDREQALRFADSCKVTPPWHVFANAEGGYSVALPSFAIDVASELGDNIETNKLFFLGGKNALVFVLITSLLDLSEPVPVEARLEAGANALGSEGRQIIVQSPVVVDGTRGRDVLVAGEGQFTRYRLLVGERRMFVIGVGASNKEALTGDDVKRFFGSFRWRD